VYSKYTFHSLGRDNPMRLTTYTDYSLRTLIALALNPDEWQTVTVVSKAYGISRHHLVKVVARLAERGYVETQRGKGGVGLGDECTAAR